MGPLNGLPQLFAPTPTALPRINAPVTRSLGQVDAPAIPDVPQEEAYQMRALPPQEAAEEVAEEPTRYLQTEFLGERGLKTYGWRAVGSAAVAVKVRRPPATHRGSLNLMERMVAETPNPKVVKAGR